MQVDTEPKPCSVFWQQSQKKQKCFAFPLKKGERERNEDVVERNGSPSATALLNPYARLWGRKYPQFSVIRVEAAYPVGTDLVELIGHH